MAIADHRMSSARVNNGDFVALQFAFIFDAIDFWLGKVGQDDDFHRHIISRKPSRGD